MPSVSHIRLQIDIMTSNGSSKNAKCEKILHKSKTNSLGLVLLSNITNYLQYCPQLRLLH